MRIKFSKVDKQAGIAILIGLAIRFIFMPFAMPIEADGITRVFRAMEWLAKPELISYGVWGPLHTYLIAGSLLLWNDPVYAPVALNNLFSAAVAIPLYLFVKREWDETAGLFVICLYLLYPLAIRYGLVAMSEIPYIFFMMIAMLFLSIARDEGGNWKHAMVAGLTVTVAGSLRYEAWGLTPFLGLLLWRQWRKLFVFLAASALFPIFWTAGNYMQFGDPLYSFTWSIKWNLVISNSNESLTALDVVHRALFYPRSLFFGLTPFVFLICLLGVYFVILRRGKQWVWLIPFLALFLTFTINSMGGKLSLQVRYSLGLAIFLIPFAAEWFEYSKSSPRRLLICIIILCSMPPFSCLRSAVSWPYNFPNPIPEQINMLPRVDEKISKISEFQIEQANSIPGGLFLDFFGWSDTYYVASMSRKHPFSIFIMPGEINESIDKAQFARFVEKNPTGMMLLTETPRFVRFERSPGGQLLHFEGFDTVFLIESIGKVEGITFYKYLVMP